MSANTSPAPAIGKAQSQQVAAHEAPQRIQQHGRKAAAAAARVQRLRHQIRVAAHAGEVVREAAVREVLEVSAQALHASADARVLVDLVAAPAAAPAVEQAHQPVRVGVAVAQEAAEIVGDARHRPAGSTGEARRAQGADLVPQLRAQTLIGIQTQHPLVLRAIDRELLLRAVTGPVALDDPGAEGGGAFARAVGGMRVDDQDLVAEAQRAQARLDAVSLVVSNDAGRQAARARHASPLRCGSRIE